MAKPSPPQVIEPRRERTEPVNLSELYRKDVLDEALRPKLRKLNQPNVVTRRQWNAKFPSGMGSVEPLSFPLRQVIITLTESKPCGDVASCSTALRGVQRFFMVLGYHDIPYNFLVTTEGAIFEGRAWERECPLPEVLGDQTKSLVIGIVAESTDYIGPTKNLVDSKINEIIEHGLKYQLIEDKFKKWEVECWHYRVKHSPDSLKPTDFSQSYQGQSTKD